MAPHISGTSAVAANGAYVRTNAHRYGIVVGGCAASCRSFVVFRTGVEAVADTELHVARESDVHRIERGMLREEVDRLFDAGDSNARAAIDALASKLAALSREVEELRARVE